MDWANSMLGMPTIKKCEISGHKSKLCVFQSSKCIESTKEIDEFDEDDELGVVETEIKHVGSYGNGSRSNPECTKGSKERNYTNNSSKRMNIPTRGNDHVENGSPRTRYQSAPVNIPKLPHTVKSENCTRVDDYRSDDDDDDNVDGDYKEKIPPHELIAKQLARSQLSSFSVYEGAGRTLKGRDLSRVRNSIFARTGFID